MLYVNGRENEKTIVHVRQHWKKNLSQFHIAYLSRISASKWGLFRPVRVGARQYGSFKPKPKWVCPWKVFLHAVRMEMLNWILCRSVKQLSGPTLIFPPPQLSRGAWVLEGLAIKQFVCRLKMNEWRFQEGIWTIWCLGACECRITSLKHWNDIFIAPFSKYVTHTVLVFWVTMPQTAGSLDHGQTGPKCSDPWPNESGSYDVGAWRAIHLSSVQSTERHFNNVVLRSALWGCSDGSRLLTVGAKELLLSRRAVTQSCLGWHMTAQPSKIHFFLRASSQAFF